MCIDTDDPAVCSDMHMEHPQPTFAYLVALMREQYPKFSYLHVVEPRAAGSRDRTPLAGESNDFLRVIWKSPDSEKNGSVYLSAGGYAPDTALADAEKNEDLIVFGRHFIPNVSLSFSLYSCSQCSRRLPIGVFFFAARSPGTY